MKIPYFVPWLLGVALASPLTACNQSSTGGDGTCAGATLSSGIAGLTLEIFAGDSTVLGTADGTGAAARFNASFGISSDASGNVFVADSQSESIRKISPTAVVSTFAGTPGINGITDGTGAAASFNVPTDVAVDRLGNIFVVEDVNKSVRKITPAGVVTTIAGTSMDGPYGIAIDSSDNLFIADYRGQKIVKITAAGIVSDFAGAYGGGSDDGTGLNAKFGGPMGIAIDGSDNIYVTDEGNHTIRKITQAGVVTTIAGMAGQQGYADCIGTAARFQHPQGIDIDSSGNLYVVDHGNVVIRKISPAGVVTTLAGTAGVNQFSAAALPSSLKNPKGLTLSGSSLFISDQHAIAVIRNLP